MFVRGPVALTGAALVVVTALAALTMQPAVAAAQSGVEPGTLDGGGPSQTGWWSRSNEPPPDTGLAAPPEAPEPTVPAGSLAVASVLGEQHKVSAIEFSLEGEPGGLVSELTLSLRESAEDGVNAGAEQAAIVACPITTAFWVPAEGGQWRHVPEHDCESSAVAGSREAGVWTFDLTVLASSWLAADHTGSRGVVLVGAPAAADAPPTSFQVVFDGVDAEGIGVRAVVEDAPPTTLPGDGVTAPAPGGAGTTGGAGSTGGGFEDVAGGVGGVGDLGAPVADAGEVPAGDLAPVDAGSAPAPVAADGEQAPALVSASPQAPAAWYSGLGPSALLLLVLGLGLAYLVMVALGPDAQPVGGQGRRGVSRALDRMRAVGAGIRGVRA